jgi:hypothetical protein
MQYKEVIERLNESLKAQIEATNTFLDADSKVILTRHTFNRSDDFDTKYGDLNDHYELGEDQEWYITEYHEAGCKWTVELRPY